MATLWLYDDRDFFFETCISWLVCTIEDRGNHCPPFGSLHLQAIRGAGCCYVCARGFHSLEEFDEGKRSCRKRLDGHNCWRRKPKPEPLSHAGSFLSNYQGVAVRPSRGIRDEFGASIWAASFTASLSRLPLCSVSVYSLSAPPINDRCNAPPHGFSAPSTASPSGVYYLQTAQGEKVICAIAIPGEGNHMTYRPFDTFLEEYHAVLPLTRTLEWNFKFQLAAWLDGIVYYSFLQCSKEGVGSCWFLAHASPVNVVQRLP